MNSKDIATSTPNTIQSYDNYLKDYVNTSGFKWDSTCLDVAFTNLANNFERYIQKIGVYNTVTATNPQYTPPRSYQEKDYSQKCPEKWTGTDYSFNGAKWTTCKNLDYTGPCDSAGRTKPVKRPATCPTKNYDSRSPSNYAGWSGPTDASQGDFNNTNIGRKNQNEGSYCTAGSAARNSISGAWLDCNRSGGKWVNYYSDPNFNNHGYTCYKPTQYDNVTEPQSSFSLMGTEKKREWENNCKSYWPIRTINVPGKWTCTYGQKLEDDIARGNIFQIGTTNSISEAAKIALKSNRMKDNYFFMLDGRVFIVGGNSNVGVFTSKGKYQPNCAEQNNRMGTLYLINETFFKMLSNCKVVNDKINSVNESRDILQDAITSVREGFTSLENIKDINKNQNEITANLAANYNKKAELYNYQVDLIGQNDKLIEDHNKKLNNQLDELSQIQDQIALKDRVIVLNDELATTQIRNKKILIGFFVLIPFLGIPLLLIVSKVFSPMIGIGIAVLMIVGYIIYIIVVANQSGIKKFGRENKNIISKYEKSLANYWNKQKEALRSSLNKFVNKECADGSGGGGGADGGGADGGGVDGGGGGGSGVSGAYPKGDYLMKSNGPFYYYDGSAPPQQIYPGATGGINFSIEGENQKFPNIDFSKIKNPITKFFFMIWVEILLNNGIKINDPRFNEVLDVIDFPDSDQTPMPFWDNIKLPIVTNINQQFNYLFQSYSGEKKNLSQTASVLLIDLWNFIFGDKIPNEIYESWVNKLADVVKQTSPNIEKFYNDYLTEIMSSTKFGDKYGRGNDGFEKFVEIKMVDFIKTFNQDISVSQQFAKKYVP